MFKKQLQKISFTNTSRELSTFCSVSAQLCWGHLWMPARGSQRTGRVLPGAVEDRSDSTAQRCTYRLCPDHLWRPVHHRTCTGVISHNTPLTVCGSKRAFWYEASENNFAACSANSAVHPPAFCCPEPAF